MELSTSASSSTKGGRGEWGTLLWISETEAASANPSIRAVSSVSVSIFLSLSLSFSLNFPLPGGRVIRFLTGDLDADVSFPLGRFYNQLSDDV